MEIVEFGAGVVLAIEVVVGIEVYIIEIGVVVVKVGEGVVLVIDKHLM